MEQFRSALDVLLAPSFVSAGQHQSANLWLNEFATTPQAWEAAFSLLQQPGSAPASHTFFAANLLLTKTRQEWGKLSEAQRAHISSSVRACLQLPLEPVVLQRIVLVMACVAVREGSSGVDQLCSSALSLAAGAQSPDQLRYALVMLAEVRTEAGSLDTSRAKAAAQPMASHLRGVVGLVQQVVTNAGAAGGPAILLAALRCLIAWSDSMGIATPGATMTLGLLQAEFPALFSALFGLLGDPGTADDARHEVTQTFEKLLAAASDEETAAVAAAAQLVGLQPVISRPDNAAGAASVAAVATAISDGCSDFIAGISPSSLEGPAKDAATNVALQLAQLMLTCISRPEKEVTDRALDYFVNLNTVAVAKRAEPLRSSLYAQALPLLVPKAAYPPSFTSWEEEEEDEQSFSRFRDHQLSEVLECCCSMLGARVYLSLISSAATSSCASPDDWRNYEAALFCVRAVSMPLKVQILGKERAGLGLQSRAVEQVTEAAYASTVLSSIFGRVTGPLPHMQNPFVLKEACRLIAEFTAWMDRVRSGSCEGLPAEATRVGAQEAHAALQAAPPPPLHAVLTVVIRGLGSPQAANSAAQALRNICARCGDSLTDTVVLQGLMEGTMGVVAPSPHHPPPPFVPGLHERQTVVEGIARVVGLLPHGQQIPQGLSMADGAMALTSPLLQRAQAAAQAGTSVHPEALKSLADDLRLLASALRFMDTWRAPPGAPTSQAGSEHPALQVLQSAWTVLEGVAVHPACQREFEVVAAVCEVYQRALVATRSSGHVLLPPLLSATTTLFSATPHPGCCDVLGTVAEIFGEAKRPELAALQAGVLSGMISTAYNVLQGGATAPNHGDLIRALYQMADRYLVFARDVLLGVPSLPQLVALAAPSVRQREREPVVGALVFLGRLFGAAGKVFSPEQQPLLDRLTACLMSEGLKLVNALLMTATDAVSRQLARPLAGTIWAVLHCEALQNAGREWVVTAMQGPEFSRACHNVLPPEEASRFCAALVRVPPLPRGRFDALVVDLSAVLRGEASADVVLSYEM